MESPSLASLSYKTDQILRVAERAVGGSNSSHHG
ncbi:mCG1049992 [Mus musculus]|nr:mCG1049992 [Mus musculus]